MKLSELIKSLEQAKLDVERMEEERNDLIGKVTCEKERKIVAKTL